VEVSVEIVGAVEEAVTDGEIEMVVGVWVLSVGNNVVCGLVGVSSGWDGVCDGVSTGVIFIASQATSISAIKAKRR
jgi:hypothetical protein